MTWQVEPTTEAGVNAKTHRVTAIIVSYNSAGEIGAALTALRPAHESGELSCIVVDNVSCDETVALVRREHAWATIIESSVNLGYGRGLNAGLERVTTPVPDRLKEIGIVNIQA